uniref:Uncharacterized protein n=1 Tax=Myoviridae sp. ctwVB15 TaxID=2825208 RepID=A0A8S5UNB4_9CAUD|nr:MAG TPA: hypothetical protein [Myoviridae sp. ctwVB15]
MFIVLILIDFVKFRGNFLFTTKKVLQLSFKYRTKESRKGRKGRPQRRKGKK